MKTTREAIDLKIVNIFNEINEFAFLFNLNSMGRVRALHTSLCTAVLVHLPGTWIVWNRHRACTQFSPPLFRHTCPRTAILYKAFGCFLTPRFCACCELPWMKFCYSCKGNIKTTSIYNDWEDLAYMIVSWNKYLTFKSNQINDE